MRAFFGHSRPIAALAAFALLLAALLPALSAAQRSVQADDSPWLVICSAHNPLSSVASRAPVTDDDATATAHCPLCGSAQHAMAPPPVPGSPVAPDSLRSGPPLRFLHAGQPLFAWAARYSRGPPALS